MGRTEEGCELQREGERGIIEQEQTMQRKQKKKKKKNTQVSLFMRGFSFFKEKKRKKRNSHTRQKPFIPTDYRISKGASRKDKKEERQFAAFQQEKERKIWKSPSSQSLKPATHQREGEVISKAAFIRSDHSCLCALLFLARAHLGY